MTGDVVALHGDVADLAVFNRGQELGKRQVRLRSLAGRPLEQVKQREDEQGNDRAERGSRTTKRFTAND